MISESMERRDEFYLDLLAARVAAQLFGCPVLLVEGPY
jgi:hypothetical protein